MDNGEFSEKLMKLSLMIQKASPDKQKAFSHLFLKTKEAIDQGFTQEELQIIIVTAYQISTNPQLKQLYSILMGEFDINPEGEFH